ncbi:MAG: hypothetical protein N2661_12075, partial [Anoxybacillus mongoliensis]|nr:hypothetical protein [Anoxybacillus mongoliensis]
ITERFWLKINKLRNKRLHTITSMLVWVLSKVLKAYPKFLLIFCSSRQKKLATPAVFGTIEVTPHPIKTKE